MRKIFMVAFLLMAMLSTGCGSDSDSKGLSIIKNNTIKVGIDDQHAPFGFHDENGEIIGFDVDLAKEMARRMNVEVEFIPIDWSKKKEEITSGNIDMIWNGMDIIPEREEYMIFSKPYMENRQILLIKKAGKLQKAKTKSIYSIDDLKGCIVGTQAGSTSEDYINNDEDLKSSLKKFKTYLNYKEAIADLDKDLIDVLIIDEIVARYEMQRRIGKFETIELTIGPVTAIGIGFRKNNVELRDNVQIVFDSMVKDGTAKKISEKWFQADLIKLKK